MTDTAMQILAIGLGTTSAAISAYRLGYGRGYRLGRRDQHVDDYAKLRAAIAERQKR